jgi:hypothetical protein
MDGVTRCVLPSLAAAAVPAPAAAVPEESMAALAVLTGVVVLVFQQQVVRMIMCNQCATASRDMVVQSARQNSIALKIKIRFHPLRYARLMASE